MFDLAFNECVICVKHTLTHGWFYWDAQVFGYPGRVHFARALLQNFTIRTVGVPNNILPINTSSSKFRREHKRTQEEHCHDDIDGMCSPWRTSGREDRISSSNHHQCILSKSTVLVILTLRGGTTRP